MKPEAEKYIIRNNIPIFGETYYVRTYLNYLTKLR